MSMCVVHMMKLKMDAMGGIQSHNQREHESTKNKEIDYDKSHYNYDTVNDGNISYRRAVKERISQLDLKRALRKDATVCCSFIISSDRAFFESLGELQHIKRESESRESVSIGLEPPTPFEYTNESYKEDCIREGAKLYFQYATEFFMKRYGWENVTNGSVHFDEATPHMHLGVIPVTSDGRLSAKDLFNKAELRQLQTDFAKEMGKRFDLERGKEGSKAKHLSEIDFKIMKRTEQLEKLEQDVHSLQWEERTVQRNVKDLEEHVESLSKTVSDLKADIITLDTQKRLLERITAQLEQYKAELKKAIEKIREKAVSSGFNLLTIDKEIQRERALDFIEQTGQAEKFKEFCDNPKNRFTSPFIAKGQTEKFPKRNTEHER